MNLRGGEAFYILIMPGSVRHNNSIYGRLARQVGQVGFRLVALLGAARNAGAVSCTI